MKASNDTFLNDSFCSASVLEQLDPIINNPNNNLKDTKLTTLSNGQNSSHVKPEKRKCNAGESSHLKKSRILCDSFATSPTIAIENIPKKKLFPNETLDGRKKKSQGKLMKENPRNESEDLENTRESDLSNSLLSTQEKRELASWGLPESILKNYSKNGIKTMFGWQVECLTMSGVLDGRNLVYSAPTSAGKTLVAEILLLKKILETNGKGIFILPFVSVAREKTKHLQSLLKGTEIRAEGFMGSHAPPGGFKATNIAVCTIEKANNIINRLLEEKRLSEISIIVIDELHMVRDSHRGYLLELLLTKLRYVSLQSDEESRPQLIGMSATLPNISVLSKWLEAALYSTTFRPIPLLQMVKMGNTIYDKDFNKIREMQPEMTIKDDADGLVQLCVETLLDGLSVLVFCPTKAWCEKMALLIASCLFAIGKPGSLYPSLMATGIRSRLDGQALSGVIEALTKTPAGLDAVLAKSLAFGAAFHHAGLTMEERDIVEGAFRAGHLPVLVATSTLSSGVNLPARRVIIRSPNSTGGLLDILTYHQMVGRAGRKGKDTQGESILMCAPNEKYKAQSLIQSALPPIKSCLYQHSSVSASMKRAILEVVVSGAAQTSDQIKQYCACSLLAATVDEEEMNFQETIELCLDYLKEKEFVRSETIDGIVSLKGTQLGKAALASGLSPDESLSVFHELHRARRNFVLENELHVVYQVTPIYVSDSWPNLDWMTYLELWEKLSPDMRRVGELVGVQESFIVRALKGTVNSKIAAMRHSIAIHQRFYAALALHDLVHEVPLTKVIYKYGATKGLLQALQQSAATFAGMVTVFTHELGWRNLELLIEQYQDRLQFGIQRELCDLVRLSLLNGRKARVLYNAGLETVSHVANADVIQIQDIFMAASPFLTNEEKTANGAHFWGSDGTPILLQEAAKILIEEARDLITKDVGITDINWKKVPSKPSQKPRKNLPKSSKAEFLFSKKQLPPKKNETIGSILDQSLTEEASISRHSERNLTATLLESSNRSPEIDFSTTLKSPSHLLDSSSHYSEDLFGPDVSQQADIEVNPKVNQLTPPYSACTETLDLAFDIADTPGPNCTENFMEVNLTFFQEDEDVVTEAGVMSLTRENIENDLKSFEAVISSKILTDTLSDTYLEKAFDSFNNTSVNNRRNTISEADTVIITPNRSRDENSTPSSVARRSSSIARNITKESDNERPKAIRTYENRRKRRSHQTVGYLNLEDMDVRVVTSSADQFESFLKLWEKQKEFSMVFATEKNVKKNKNQGIGFRVCGRTSRKRRNTAEPPTAGLIIERSSSLLVGVAITWEPPIVYYISLCTVTCETDNSGSLSTSQRVCNDLPIEKRVHAIKKIFKLKTFNRILSDDARKTLLTGIQSGLGLINANICDPKTAHWLLNPTLKIPDLQAMALKFGNIRHAVSKNKMIGKSSSVTTSSESLLIHHLMKVFTNKLNENELWEVYEKMEMPTIRTLVCMELNGMAFNNILCEQQKKLIEDKMDMLEKEAHLLAGQSFSLSSPKDVARIVYDELGLTHRREDSDSKTPGKRRPTDKEALEILQDQHKMPSIIIEWRKLHAALTMTMVPLQQSRQQSAVPGIDRIHPVTFTFTATGRVTLQEPSLQMIPKDFDIKVPQKELAHLKLTQKSRAGNVSKMLTPTRPGGYTVSLRHAFVAGPGNVLLSADYRQLELRILAHLSGDENLLNLLNSGEDPFTNIASQIARVPVTRVTPKQRDQAKQICYGTIYGMGDKALGQQLGSEEDATAFLESFRKTFPVVHSYLREIVDKAAEQGFVQTLKGRRRYLPDILSRNSHLRSSCERQAVNTTIQGSAADIVKSATLLIEEALTEAFPTSPLIIHSKLSRDDHHDESTNSGAYFILQLHDELIYEVFEEDLVQVGQLIKHHMETCVLLSVNLSVKLKVGETWGSMRELVL